MCAYSVFNTFPVYPLSAKPLILLAFCRYRYHTSLLGQPVYANIYENAQKDHFYSQPIPWYFTGLTTLINLHIHNHNTIALKIVWAIWMVILSVASLFGALLTFQRWRKWNSWTKTPIATATIMPEANQGRTWTRPIVWGGLTLIGMFIPLTGIPHHNEIALIALILPLIDMVYVLAKK